MITPLLLLCAATLLGAPHLLVRAERLRRSPRAALLVWQALSFSAVLCLLTAAPLALVPPRSWPSTPLEVAVLAVACVAAAGVLLRLLTHGHRVGRRIRAIRAEHRELVDLLGRHQGRTRVLPSPHLSAYCLPGAHSRLVITEATLTDLPEEQLEAVLAHEEAHLRERHDLVLEFFTVLHSATPPLLRTEAALREVTLLVEVLADRAARSRVGEVALGRAITSLAEAAAQHELTPGASPGHGAAAARIRLLTAEAPPPWQTLGLYLICVTALVAPPVLAVGLAA